MLAAGQVGFDGSPITTYVWPSGFGSALVWPPPWKHTGGVEAQRTRGEAKDCYEETD
jgi:hypothetical protein